MNTKVAAAMKFFAGLQTNQENWTQPAATPPQAVQTR